MAIEISCSGCQQMLRVGDEHAGKKARCPKCGTVNVVPGPGASDAGMGAGTSPSGWSTPPAATFSNTPPAFGSAPMPSKPSPFDSQNPFSDKAAPDPNPYSSPHAPNIAFPQFQGRPHRGGTVLTFGILGLVCCGFFGIAAWVMGASDLSAMKSGAMDPSGHSLTMVGMILGIVSVGFLVLGALIQIAAIGIG